MKKTIKQVLVFAVALIMCMATIMPAMAEGTTTTGKIDLTGGKKGHTYTLYQIFQGTVDGTKLKDIQWGDDAPNSLKTQYATAAAAAKAVETQNDARAFAQSLTDLTGGTELKLTADDNVTFNNLAPGYYLITDTKNAEAAAVGDYSSAFIVGIVGGTVSGAMKGSGAESNKKVADNNDTTQIQPDLSDLQNTDWQDSADYDIGDYVPFRLQATTSANVASFRKYHVTFQDKQSAGLAAPQSFTVTVLGETFKLLAGGTVDSKVTENGTKITVAHATPESGQTFAIKVTFEPDVKNQTGETYLNAECNSTVIEVKYTSKLTGDDVVIGKPGNPNEMYIKYSNNPEDKDDEDEGKTKEDKVVVFTYKTLIDKVDETGADLSGAMFELYKEVPKETTGADTGANIKKDWTDEIKTAAAALADAKYYVVAAAGDLKSITGDKKNQFAFKGIDDATYVLVETKVPDGYNPWNATQFTIVAAHDESSDNPQLTSLSGEPLFDANEWTGEVTIEKKNKTNKVTQTGEMFKEIENKSGATLPETGGMGTTIFYVIGGILVLAAAIILISRRRVQQ